LFDDLSAELCGKVDAIISNPPYIISAEIGDLAPEVKDYEPTIALDGGKDGLCIIREIVRQSPRFLKRGGLLALEVGYGQAERVREMMSKAGYGDIKIVKDYSGIDRIITCKANRD
jgi:release factor glutamine methyltransferase